MRDRFVSLPIGERKAIEWIARLRAGLVERIVDRAESRQLLNTRESTSKSARFTELLPPTSMFSRSTGWFSSFLPDSTHPESSAPASNAPLRS